MAWRPRWAKPRPFTDAGRRAARPVRRLEFAAFSVKSMPMTLWGSRITGSGRGKRRAFACALAALAVVLVLGAPAVVSAQMFTDRPPPIPPAPVPDTPGGAISLAPPAAPAPAPALPAPLTQPPP